MISSGERIINIYVYLKAVFWEGMLHKALTIIDIAALFGAFFPNWIADRLFALGLNIATSPTQNIALIALFVSFFTATLQVSFGIFEKDRNKRVSIKPIHCRALSPSDFLKRTKEKLEVEDKVCVKFAFELDITACTPTRLTLSIISIESKWHLSVDCNKIELTRLIHNGIGKMQPGEPLIFENSGVARVPYEFAAYFDIPSNDSAVFKYLGALSQISVRLNVEQDGYTTFSLPIFFEVEEIHQCIQNAFVRQLRFVFVDKGGNNKMLQETLSALQVYWRARGGVY